MPEKTLEPTDAEKIRRIPWVLASNASNMTCVHLTFMGSVFILFLNELGLSKTQIGSMLSLIPFFSVMALFIAPIVVRAGNKKIFLVFHAARNLVTICLLFSPLVLEKYGLQALLWYVAAIVAAFALFRSIALTARYPWSQEFVPSTVRGKFSAAGQIVNGVVVFIAVTASGYYLGPCPDTQRFVLIFGVGSLAGLISVWANLFVPGGAPITDKNSDQTSYQGLFTAFKDRNLQIYIAGDGLVIIASAALNSFVPLYMREAIGLNSGNVVLLQSVVLIGGLISSFLWGWAADRYGSKPITLSGIFLKALLPVFLFIIPRNSQWSLPAAIAVSLWQGFAGMGWSIGSTRMLYVSVVPQIKRMTYMAIYFASIGIIEGASQMFSGRLLDSAGALQGRMLGFTIDRYSILFLIGILLPLLGIILYRRVRADSNLSVTRFAGMFLRGNPLLAMESLIGYQFAKGETAVVSATERLGRAKSPLTVEELEETLSDPRFNVRFEAIVSIAHHGSDPRLTKALVRTLQGSDPALSTLAAWALGRSGDPAAIPPLREGLRAPYRSVQAHCARSLATLGDTDIAPVLLDRFKDETDKGLQIAIAAALGTLRWIPSTHNLLDLLWKQPPGHSRREIALALARIVGEEHFFVNLIRHRDGDIGTALSQAVTSIGKKLSGDTIMDLPDILNECADALARNEIQAGIDRLIQALEIVPALPFESPEHSIQEACAAGLREFGVQRIEYLILALHNLNAIIENLQAKLG